MTFNRKTVVLTTEQAQRLGALSLDALSTVRIETSDTDLDACFVSFIPIENVSGPDERYAIFTDGSYQPHSP